MAIDDASQDERYATGPSTLGPDDAEQSAAEDVSAEQENRYSIGKPRRIIIRAKISDAQS